MKNIITYSKLIVVLFFTTLRCFSQTYYVDANMADNSGSGTSWATAKKDLQEAINLSASGSQIWVKMGTYKPTKNVTGSSSPADLRDKTFLLKSGVAVYGGFAGSETTLGDRNVSANLTTLSGDFNNDDVVSGSGSTLSITNNGENAYHVLVSSANSTSATLLDGFSIIGGNASGIGAVTVGINNINRDYGGGIFITNSNINISNCSFNRCHANADGGALQIFDNSQNAISNCIFQLNSAGTNGGGIGIEYTDTYNRTTTIDNCKFIGNNAASAGGGLYILFSAMNISNSYFNGNYSTDGGGLYNYSSHSKINSSTFYNNSASGGGGIKIESGDFSITNTNFIANNSLVYGGGLLVGQSNPIITNCTFNNNLATSNGDNIYYSTAGGGVLNNCIVWNTNGNGNGDLWSDNTSSSLRVTINNCILQNATGNPLAIPNVNMDAGNLNSNPLFMNTADPDGADNIWMNGDDGLRLRSCSPAINTGNNTNIPSGITADITGTARIQLTTVDMGAYEASNNTADNNATLANIATSITKTQGTATLYLTNCMDYIALVQQNGSNPIRNSVTAKVWIENTQNPSFVKRHYEITPADQPSNYGGTVTLFFTQKEFDDFNAVNSTKLPINPNDNTGKANLLCEKIGGTSSDGTGLPGTYSGTVTSINPNDANIIWNATNSRWEITFDVAGFSGFFVKTQATPLPLTLINFTGTNIGQSNYLQWKTVNETNVDYFEIQKSEDSKAFTKIGEVKANNSKEILEYQFTDYKIPLSGAEGQYYHLKMVDLDGKYGFSKIIALENKENSHSKIRPNPSHDYINLSVKTSLLNSEVKLLNTLGQELKIIKINDAETRINISELALGTYFLLLKNGETMKFLKE